jgi:hypothetical protein
MNHGGDDESESEELNNYDDLGGGRVLGVSGCGHLAERRGTKSASPGW